MRNYIRTVLIIKARRPAMLRDEGAGLCRECVLTMRNDIRTVLDIRAPLSVLRSQGLGPYEFT